MKFKIAFLLSSQQPDGGLNTVEERGYETNNINKTFPSLPLVYVLKDYLTGFGLHDIRVLLIKTNGRGRQSIRYQVDPQQLDLKSQRSFFW